MRVVVTGGTGFVGRRVVEALADRGDDVVVFSRNPLRAMRELPANARAAAWTPEREGPWSDELGRADAVVHLAGEPVAVRWTEEKKRSIEESRVGSTRRIVDAIGRMRARPRVLVCASAIGYYGPRPATETLTETSRPGRDFLAGVVERWEAAAREVEAHGVRAVELRIGVVLGKGGGALEPMVKPFRFFAGGPIGPGDQIVSWIHVDDVVGLALFALDREEAKGPMNAVSPEPVTADELARAIGRALHRPSWLRAPSLAVKAALGEAASVVTTGQRVLPARAQALGYAFRHPHLDEALASILG